MAESSGTTIISWNMPNWLTVSLMVGLMYFMVAAAVKIYKEKATA